MILEIHVRWITLSTAFSHYLESTLSQTFIMHRLVFYSFLTSEILMLILFILFLFCRLELTTALSHHLERQSTSWNAEVRSVYILLVLLMDVCPICTKRNCTCPHLCYSFNLMIGLLEWFLWNFHYVQLINQFHYGMKLEIKHNTEPPCVSPLLHFSEILVFARVRVSNLSNHGAYIQVSKGLGK